MDRFGHERLDVYRSATEFIAVAEEIAGAIPKGRAYLVDQLRRAALSIALNIAEGAGEVAAADKARFYRMARRSATECAAILDACRVLKLCDEAVTARGRELLFRTNAMLTALVLKLTARLRGQEEGANEDGNEDESRGDE